MPATVQDYSNRTVGEIVLFAMDFSLNLNDGETINSTIWTCSIVSGNDPAAAGRVLGTAGINGPISSQLIDFSSGVTSGNKYLLICTVITSLGENLIGFAHTTVIGAT